MDTSPFSGSFEFSLIDDLVALFSFKTDASISFLVGRWASNRRAMFNCAGWLDVRHPCKAHVKTQLRIKVPKQYHHFEAMRSIVQSALASLGIPLDE